MNKKDNTHNKVMDAFNTIALKSKSVEKVQAEDFLRIVRAAPDVVLLVATDHITIAAFFADGVFKGCLSVEQLREFTTDLKAILATAHETSDVVGGSC